MGLESFAAHQVMVLVVGVYFLSDIVDVIQISVQKDQKEHHPSGFRVLLQFDRPRIKYFDHVVSRSSFPALHSGTLQQRSARANASKLPF